MDVTQLKQKVELRLEKTGPMRFISHHDMMRLVERACRRAELPLRFSSGFNPRPRIVLPVPLEVGVESQDEPIEVELSDWVPIPEIRRRLTVSMPPRVRLRAVKLLPPRRGSQPPVEALYSAFPGRAGIEISEQAVAEFIMRETIPWERRRPNETVRLDLRKGVKSLELQQGVLSIRVSLGKGSPRPFEILEYLLKSRSMALMVPVKRMKTVLAPVEVGGRPVPKRRRR